MRRREGGGLLGGGGDQGGGAAHYKMREKLLSFGDDFWIEDERGRRAYFVDGKAVRVLARQHGRGLAEMAEIAGTPLVGGPGSLKAALDLDWDDPQARTQGLVAVLGTLDALEQWLAHHPTTGDAAMDAQVQASCAAAIQVRTQDVPGEVERHELDPAVAHHQAVYGRPPHLLAADRGFHVTGQEATLQTLGVRHVVVPASGRPTIQQRAQERTRAWKRRYRWRAGIEGRIHSLRRDYGLRRRRSHGEGGLLRDVGWGILASDLRHIAQRLVA